LLMRWGGVLRVFIDGASENPVEYIPGRATVKLSKNESLRKAILHDRHQMFRTLGHG
jgi:hypothetical protein